MMKVFKRIFSLFPIFILSSFSLAAFADGVVQVVAPSEPSLSLGGFLQQVLQAIQMVGGVATMVKISVLITLVIASMKVSVLNQWIWSKLGNAQVWIAPLLGLVAGVLGLGAGGVKLSIPLVFAYISAGGGAVFLHEILDSIKAIPGLGPVYVSGIDMLEKYLGAKQPPAPPAA